MLAEETPLKRLSAIMVVFSGKQVFPVDYEAEVSQRLVQASLAGDLKSTLEFAADPCVDVNFADGVCLRTTRTELVPRGESPSEVRVGFDEFRSDVTALFVAVHSGNVALTKKLLSIGADVNQKLFRGFATTAAVREGHYEIIKILVKDGASQPACEEALLEASCHGRANFAELLMASDLIRPHVAVHALVTASCRGFVEFADSLIKCGVDPSASDRVLLQSSKPSLHANVDCTSLVAAIVSRQVSIVRLLLQAGARADIDVKIGAWSWDMATGEELRVGAGLAEPYPVTWCAVEYFESSGAILRMLLQQNSIHALHCGRTLLHHAILCGNGGAVSVLLSCGAHRETPVEAGGRVVFRPIHLAARLGYPAIVRCLIDSGCDVDSRTGSDETALMISARYKQEACLRVLAMAGADFGLVNSDGQSASLIAAENNWSQGFEDTIMEVIKTRKFPTSSELKVFCPLIAVAQAGDIEALEALINREGFDVDYQDENGLSAVMIAASKGYVEAFRLLVYAGADVKLANKSGETALTLSESNQCRDLFEKVMLEFALEKGNRNAGGFYALHCAARRGDLDAVKLLTSRGYDVNLPDGDGYTPLMLGAREGHGAICRVLITHNAKFDYKNDRGETAISLARKNGRAENEAYGVLLDELAREVVTVGVRVQKHTKGGKGNPHEKDVRMVRGTGVLCWGKSRQRNVMCREAELGPSQAFRRNRKSKGGADEPGLFRVITEGNKEVHFVCKGGNEAAELWVRGIKLVTKEACTVAK